MASQIVALAFDGVETAEGILDNVIDMQQRGLLKLDDAVVLSRPAGTSEVQVKQTDSRRGRYALIGGGAGMLAGWLVGGPIGGAAIGAIIGAMRDRGLPDSFVNTISGSLGPDSSALVVLVKDVDGPTVLEELKPFKGRVVHTTLSDEQEKRLRETLAHEA